MIKIEIKPLSVNEVWKGQRFKTQSYSIYENAILFMLPKLNIPPAPYQVELEFGFSSKAADLDNPVKPILDILQKKYKIDDKNIFSMNLKKVIVPKGQEYFKFKIESMTS